VDIFRPLNIEKESIVGFLAAFCKWRKKTYEFKESWIPACAGMTEGAGMTELRTHLKGGVQEILPSP